MFISLTEFCLSSTEELKIECFYIIKTGQKEFLPHDFLEYSIETVINSLIHNSVE